MNCPCACGSAGTQPHNNRMACVITKRSRVQVIRCMVERFQPLSCADVQRIKDEKRLKQQAEKLRISESRNHLANYRVLQKVSKIASTSGKDILRLAQTCSFYSLHCRTWYMLWDCLRVWPTPTHCGNRSISEGLERFSRYCCYSKGCFCFSMGNELEESIWWLHYFHNMLSAVLYSVGMWLGIWSMPH